MGRKRVAQLPSAQSTNYFEISLTGMEFPETAERLMTPTMCSCERRVGVFFLRVARSTRNGIDMTRSYGYLIVFLGAGVGGMLRQAVTRATFRLFGPDLPVGTFAVNVLGSLAMGMIAGYFLLRGHADQEQRLFLTTGVLGGFTTFSAFSLETALMMQRGQATGALLYAGASVVLSVGGIFGGLALMRS